MIDAGSHCCCAGTTDSRSIRHPAHNAHSHALPAFPPSCDRLPKGPHVRTRAVWHARSCGGRAPHSQPVQSLFDRSGLYLALWFGFWLVTPRAKGDQVKSWLQPWWWSFCFVRLQFG
ncbi:hypothetical protein AMAG_17999 [Allomyces macrogynus ATCC 38327]|uniref:Uncharacterized protein n=1 Tax=Allomyces macrogynus (strain ATCC 38327) TaxID=578462 RepID=A0A0L0S3T3_ALLM3|nr:hypothetical protein AMAG_17999 [Allomyces macrogynus ATCC 38327]|eukprot:KNE57060.1 hypothetical protein AMAG_17999 [Allomyces macrogynus ATCC 38327]